jgi:hypothetical protein
LSEGPLTLELRCASITVGSDAVFTADKYFVEGYLANTTDSLYEQADCGGINTGL